MDYTYKIEDERITFSLKVMNTYIIVILLFSHKYNIIPM